MLIPTIYSKSHRSDANSVFGMEKSSRLLEKGRIRSKLCWLPATAAASGEHVLSCPIDEINGDTRLCT
ncbi:hypothetical protein Y032_0021g347 [Ancylostoma ceylanicum]|uniref:Uncharacterized protein n=1 Tax=Ancylostoma ceylanicum TaxID=53326 RepID=A0A016V0X4_9BILA|nr:hypothetical protein Y032_0021g347 [Ancylostoma ceylanicum]